MHLRNPLVIFCILLVGLTALTASGFGADAPNILVLTADDLSADTVGAFGGSIPDLTPNIDRLAAEGMRFEHAHVTTTVCQPSRQALLTGMLPHRQGAPGFFPVEPHVPTIGDHLKPLGYYLGAINKIPHIQPLERFGFDRASDGEVPAGRAPKDLARVTREMIRSAKEKRSPFFLYCNSQDPHRPFHDGDKWSKKFRGFGDALTPSRLYSIDEVEVPPFLPDLPEVRQEIMQYTNSVKRLDDAVGEVLRVLDEEGVAESTLVVFWSDHGMAFPFAKGTLYPQGTRTPWIVRWPGVVKPSSVDSRHRITSLDLVPTILDVLGKPTPVELDGQSILPLLKGETQSDRDTVFTVFHGTNETTRYESRAVERNGWLYIFNAWSLEASRGKYYEMEALQGLTFPAMEKAAKQSPEIAKRVKHIRQRTPEELYNITEDPYCLKNLASLPGQKNRMAELRTLLDAWMFKKADSILPLHRAFVARKTGAQSDASE